MASILSNPNTTKGKLEDSEQNVKFQPNPNPTKGKLEDSDQNVKFQPNPNPTKWKLEDSDKNVKFQPNLNPRKGKLEDSDQNVKFQPKSSSHDFIEQRQKRKFYSLRQGGRTVAGYGTEFMKLLKYVDGVSDEKVKVNIFISGLNQRIGSCVRMLEPCTLSEAMRKAVLIEEETKQRKRRLDDSYVSDYTDRFCCEYLPDLFIQRQVYKFFSLRQGRRTVKEYTDRFMELYVSVRCLTMEQLLLNKFISGLNQWIRPIVRILEPSSISEAARIGRYIELQQENPYVNFEGLLQETLMFFPQRRSE